MPRVISSSELRGKRLLLTTVRSHLVKDLAKLRKVWEENLVVPVSNQNKVL